MIFPRLSPFRLISIFSTLLNLGTYAVLILKPSDNVGNGSLLYSFLVVAFVQASSTLVSNIQYVGGAINKKLGEADHHKWKVDVNYMPCVLLLVATLVPDDFIAKFLYALSSFLSTIFISVWSHYLIAQRNPVKGCSLTVVFSISTLIAAVLWLVLGLPVLVTTSWSLGLACTGLCRLDRKISNEGIDTSMLILSNFSRLWDLGKSLTTYFIASVVVFSQTNIASTVILSYSGEWLGYAVIADRVVTTIIQYLNADLFHVGFRSEVYWKKWSSSTIYLAYAFLVFTFLWICMVGNAASRIVLFVYVYIVFRCLTVMGGIFFRFIQGIMLEIGDEFSTSVTSSMKGLLVRHANIYLAWICLLVLGGVVGTLVPLEIRALYLVSLLEITCFWLVLSCSGFLIQDIVFNPERET